LQLKIRNIFLKYHVLGKKSIYVEINGYSDDLDHHTAFVQLKQGDVTWFEPLHYEVTEAVETSSLHCSPDCSGVYDTVSLQSYFNDKVTQIFKNKYLSPRPQSPTLQIPWQGIGNWCYPLADANINDSGTRVKAGSANMLHLVNCSFCHAISNGGKEYYLHIAMG